jgi:hypothetical protein
MVPGVEEAWAEELDQPGIGLRLVLGGGELVALERTAVGRRIPAAPDVILPAW